MTLFAAIAVAFGAVAQAMTGFGFSLVSAPFLVAAYRAPEGVQLNLLLSIVVNVLLLGRERRFVDGRAALLLLARRGDERGVGDERATGRGLAG